MTSLSTFTPPTTDVPFTGLLARWNTVRGQTVYRYNGVWHQVTDPFWGNETTTGVKDADIVPTASRPGGERTDNTDRDRYLFFGGRVYMVSADVATDLIAAGYTVTPDAGGGDDIGPGDPRTWDLLDGTWDSLTGTWNAQ